MRGSLTGIRDIFSAINQNVGTILENSPQLFEVIAATSQIEQVTGNMLEASRALEAAFAARANRQDVVFLGAIVCGALMVSALVALGVVLMRTARQRLEEQTEQGRRNQD